MLRQDGVVVSSRIHTRLHRCDDFYQVHQGEFVRGSYGPAGLGAGGGRLSGSDEEGDSRSASADDKDMLLMDLKSSNPKAAAVGAAGIRAAAAAPPSPPFVNPYSLRTATSPSSSDSDSFSSSPPSTKKFSQTAAAQSSLKLPAVHDTHAQGHVCGGPLLSGYDSWSEDDADVDRGGGGGTADDDDWSDTETPEQPAPHVLALHKLKLASATEHAPDAAASPFSSAAERVDAWAARHASGGLLGLMLHMRRCVFPKAVCFVYYSYLMMPKRSVRWTRACPSPIRRSRRSRRCSRCNALAPGSCV